MAFAGLLAFCLTIPSNWTQNVPARYAARHPGLEHSWLYPPIETVPPTAHDRDAVGRAGQARREHAVETPRTERTGQSGR